MKRIARKSYTCACCSQPIPAGTSYEALVCRPWDHPDNDGYTTYRMHEDCALVHSLVQSDYPGDDWIAPADVYHVLDRDDFEDEPDNLALVDAFLAQLDAEPA